MIKNIYIKKTKNKGRGIFAGEFIKKGDLIESAPVIVLPADDSLFTEESKSVLDNYLFSWNPKHLKEEKGNGFGALALGYGSIYNHSYKPNAEYSQRLSKKTIDFIAIKDIEKDEEITVNYNKYPDSTAELWFNVKE